MSELKIENNKAKLDWLEFEFGEYDLIKITAYYDKQHYREMIWTWEEFKRVFKTIQQFQHERQLRGELSKDIFKQVLSKVKVHATGIVRNPEE